MKRSKTPVEIQVPVLAEFVATVARMVGSNSSSRAEDKKLLMEMGFSEEGALSISEGVRGRPAGQRKVGTEPQPLTAAERLDRLIKIAQRNGDDRSALKLLQERSKLLGTADDVRLAPGHERLRRPRTATEEALEELGPVGREQLNREFRGRLFELTGRLPDGSKPPASGLPVAKSASGCGPTH
jgi:hypothetical protein